MEPTQGEGFREYLERVGFSNNFAWTSAFAPHRGKPSLANRGINAQRSGARRARTPIAKDAASYVPRASTKNWRARRSTSGATLLTRTASTADPLVLCHRHRQLHELRSPSCRHLFEMPGGSAHVSDHKVPSILCLPARLLNVGLVTCLA